MIKINDKAEIIGISLKAIRVFDKTAHRGAFQDGILKYNIPEKEQFKLAKQIKKDGLRMPWGLTTKNIRERFYIECEKIGLSKKELKKKYSVDARIDDLIFSTDGMTYKLEKIIEDIKYADKKKLARLNFNLKYLFNSLFKAVNPEKFKEVKHLE